MFQFKVFKALFEKCHYELYETITMTSLFIGSCIFQVILTVENRAIFNGKDNSF